MTYEEAKATKQRVRRPHWDEDTFVRFRDLVPGGYDTDEYPPTRPAWDPIAEHNTCGLDDEDYEATDWVFWEEPALTVYRESLIENNGDE